MATVISPTKQFTLIVVVDTTGSMASSLDAVKQAVNALRQLIELIGWRIVVICYGDYDHQRQTPERVVSIITGHEFNQYELSSNGGGGDPQEAVATAMYMLKKYVKENDLTNEMFGISPSVLLITDELPHTYSFSKGSFEAESEKKALTERGFPYVWKDVVEQVKNLCDWGVLTSHSNGQTTYGMLTMNVCVKSLTLKNVLEWLLITFNGILEAQETQAQCAINEEKFMIVFRGFAIQFPTMLIHLTFLSKKYYTFAMRSKTQREDHSRFCVNLKQAFEKHGITDGKAILDLFNQAQADIIELEHLWKMFPSDVAIRYNGGLKRFTLLKELFAGNITPEVLHQLKAIITGNFQIVNGENINKKTDLPLAVLSAPNGLTLLLSLMTLENGNMKEFLAGVLPILVSSIIRWASEIEPLMTIIVAYVHSDEFLQWLKPDATSKPHETIWNRMKLHFMMTSISKVAVMTNPIMRSRVNALERLASMVEIIGFLNQSFNPKCFLKIENLTKKDAIGRVNQMILLFDFLVEKWMPVSLFFHQTHEQVRVIVENMRRFNSHYEKTDSHFDMILNLSQQLGGLFLSIYSINCHVGDDSSVDESSGRRYGYRDVYTRQSFVNKEPPSYQTIDEMKTAYLSVIGSAGEKAFTPLNLVPYSQIHSSGSQLVCCGKKTCNNTYGRLDSSSLSSSDCRCAICRPPINQFDTYVNRCVGCSRDIISGIPTPDGISRDVCSFCLIPSSTEIIQTKVLNLCRANLETLASHFGIPVEIFEKMIRLESIAKIFREDPSNPDTATPLPKIIFEQHGWNKTLITSKSVLLLNGLTVCEESVAHLIEMFASNFMIECAICCETVQYNTASQLCQNKACMYRFCQSCVNSQLSLITAGTQITPSCVCCPMCRSPIKSSFFKRTIPQVCALFNTQNRITPVQRILNGDISVFMCSNFGNGCVAEFSFSVENNLACGVEQDADATHQCSDCLRRQALAIEQSQSTEPQGVLTETGHYVLEVDGVRTYTRVCPNDACQRQIQHGGGCFHMTCTCQTHFCWCCGFVFNDDPFEMYESISTHLSTCENVDLIWNTHPRDFYNWIYTNYENEM
jgi:hypothetical protein